MKEVHARLISKGKEYGAGAPRWLAHALSRQELHAREYQPHRNAFDPAKSANMVFEGRRQADNIIRFLKAEFPRIFAQRARTRVRQPGLRQTRWIVSRQQLTLDDIQQD